MMNWEYEEILLLIDLHDRLSNDKQLLQDVALHNFSIALNQRATQLGYSYRDVYRSIPNINRNIQYIKSIFRNLNSNNTYENSNIYVVSCNYFCQHYSNYLQNLDDIKSKYNIEIVCTTNIEYVSTYSYKYNLNPIYYKHTLISDIVEFSPRTLNALTGNVKSVFDLLMMNTDKLYAIKNIGETSVNEIERYIRSLSDAEYNVSIEQNMYSVVVDSILYNNKDDVLAGNFLLLKERELTDVECKSIAQFEHAYDCLGKELVDLCVHNKVEARLICETFDSFYHNNKIEQQRIIVLKKLLQNMPKNCINDNINKYFKRYYCNIPQVKLSQIDLANMRDISFLSFIKAIDKINKNDFIILYDFLKWCNLDLDKACNAFINLIDRHEKYKKILNMRATGATLDEIGLYFNTTRQRIEQIENIILKKFFQWNRKVNILGLICSQESDDCLVLPSLIEKYIYNNSNEILYLLKLNKCASYEYSKELGVFVIGDENLIDMAYFAIETLPAILNIHMKYEAIEQLHNQHNISAKLLELAINYKYKLTGDTLHRRALTFTIMCKEILVKYFPHGIKIANEDDMDYFKKMIFKTYGDVRIPTNASIKNIIRDVGLLCGISHYQPKQDTYISEQLKEDIHDFIELEANDIIHTTKIFNHFSAELKYYGIDNKHHCHGVLRELFQDRYAFRRDYLSKTDFSSSVYSRIHDYIIESTYSVSKQELTMVFPELTDIMLTTAMQYEPEILNFYGHYLHVSKLNIRNCDTESLRIFLTSAIQNNNVCHNLDLFNTIKYEDPNLLSKLGIYNQHSLFSLLEYLFYEEYNFQRPYIALSGVTIERNSNKLDTIILESNEILIEKIKEFARQNYIQIPRIINYINQFSETHLFKDSRTIIQEELVGINSSLIEEIECKILDEIDKTTLLIHLSCIYNFSKINVPWNEWLLYSILRKYSTKLDISVTSNRLFHATPIVAAKGTLSLSEIKNIPNTKGETLIVDLSDDLDDYWDYELGEENEL